MLRNSQDREADYLQQNDYEEARPRERRAFTIEGRPTPKYWQDPRWELHAQLMATHREYEAKQLSSKIRSDWGLY